MERAYQTNRRTVFCISFLSLQRPGWPSNRALKCGTLGKYEKPWETTAITAISPRKYLFWSRAISGETKKATPSDTLSVPLKISRSVWLYGAAIRIWTGDLILTNWLVEWGLMLSGHFVPFSVRWSMLSSTLVSIVSARSFPRVGQRVGQTLLVLFSSWCQCLLFLSLILSGGWKAGDK